MIEREIEEEIIVLCNKYNFEFQNAFLSSSDLEKKHVLAKIIGELEESKSRSVIFTMVGIFAALGIFLTKEFITSSVVLGIAYFALVIGIFTWILLTIVPRYLKIIKDLAYLKELLTIIINIENKSITKQREDVE